MATDTSLDPAALARLRELGGEDLIAKMIDLFLENTPKRIQAALQGEKSGSWHEVERAAHSIKSSAANLGFEGLRGLALEIEGAAERRRGAAIAPMLRELQAIFPAIKATLEGVRKPAAPP